MILLWILLGIATTIAFIVSFYWIKYGAPRIVLFTNLLGILLFLFSIIWTIIALYNGEMASAVSGTLIFGTSGILFILFGWKMSEKINSRRKQELIKIK